MSWIMMLHKSTSSLSLLLEIAQWANLKTFKNMLKSNDVLHLFDSQYTEYIKICDTGVSQTQIV